MKKYFIVFFISLLSMTVNAKDIVLNGYINIGDNDEDAIYPTHMLRALDSGWWVDALINPVPVNPIHFHLSEAKVLKKIELLDIEDADDRLYFVIWNANGDVVVNTRSHEDKNGKEHAGHGHAHFENDPYAPVSLPAGDYRLAVVGQCFFAGIARGWSNICVGGTQDDFEFEDIKLKMDESKNIADSISFIERRHIGDSDESGDDGYADRWYPNDEEGRSLEYKFKPNQNASSALITIHGYRDLLVNRNNIKLALYNKKGNVIDSTWLQSSKSAGDFEWSVTTNFKKKQKYDLRIYIHDRSSGDLDDISWDDIVIKFDQQDDDVTHYRIQHPLDALTCDATSVVIQACSNNGSDANCHIVDSDETLTLSVNNQDQQVNLSNGSATVSNLAQSYAGSMSLALKNKNNQYCNSSTSTSSQCNIIYAELGLKFSNNLNMDRDILDQIAGHSINPFYIRAVKDDGSGTCTELDLPTNNFDLGLECVEPNTCSSRDFFVTGKALGKNGAKTNVSLSKAMTGAYTIVDGRYDDAGKIRLSARYNFRNGTTAVGSSNDFHVRPDRFVVKATASDNNDLTDKSGGTLRHTQVAAKPFSFIVEAVNKSGNTTLNYVPNAGQAHSVSLSQTLPSNAAFDGVFTYASNKSLNISKNKSTQDLMLTAFKNGRSAFTSALYDEVGAFNVAVKDDDYYGMAFQTNTETEIGRFIPAYFGFIDGSVANYIEDGTNNITYMAQPELGLRYKVGAYNFKNNLTQNYTGDNATATFLAESNSVNASSRLSGFEGIWCEGVYRSGTCSSDIARLGVFTRDTSPDGPYKDTYFGINLTDTDGVELANKDFISSGSNYLGKQISTTSSELRYGRWTVPDGYGPLNETYSVSMIIEYFNATDFIPSKEDNKTEFDATNATINFPNDILVLDGDGTFTTGYSQGITFTAPSVEGDADFKYNADDWFEYDWSKNGNEDPEAVISFGYFRGNDRVIYRRRLN